MNEMNEMSTTAEAEQKAMTTCIHREAVKWNPYNGVVQCHRCGQVFMPSEITVRDAARLVLAYVRQSSDHVFARETIRELQALAD